MAYLNKLMIIGNLVADPELKQTPNGNSVCSFTVAVERSRKAKDENKATDYINVVAWRNTAEFVSKFFQKGRGIFLEGELQQRSFTDKDGNKRYVWEMVADQAQFVDRKADPSTQTTSGAASPYSSVPAQFEEMTSEEDLPF